MMIYHTITASIVVKPTDVPIFDPLATVIEIADEAAGPFVRVSQPGSDNPGQIDIDGREWPMLRDAIQKMVNVAQGMEADTLPEIDE